ncbi:MAG: hypothetical protein Q8O53_01760 [Candidatus Moranbacteria bacterium]|nr:hypothetical protein [Candidatus Moranbacteria bacterium]
MRFIGKNVLRLLAWKQNKHRLFLGLSLVFLFFITAVGISVTPSFPNNSEKFQNSVEVGFTSLSPRGEAGGAIIPASCESGLGEGGAAHFVGDTSGPCNPPTLLLRADPTEITTRGGASLLTWSTTNIPSGLCLKSDGDNDPNWSVSIGPNAPFEASSGSLYVFPAITKTFSMECWVLGHQYDPIYSTGKRSVVVTSNVPDGFFTGGTPTNCRIQNGSTCTTPVSWRAFNTTNVSVKERDNTTGVTRVVSSTNTPPFSDNTGSGSADMTVGSHTFTLHLNDNNTAVATKTVTASLSLAALRICPADNPFFIPLNGSQQFTAWYTDAGTTFNGNCANPNGTDVTNSSDWSTNSLGGSLTITTQPTGGYATVNAFFGTPKRISVRYAGLTAQKFIQVGAMPSLNVCPSSATIDVGEPRQFTAWYIDYGATFNGCSNPNGSNRTADSTFIWSSTMNGAVINLSTTTRGRVTGRSPGIATIQVSGSGLTANAAVTVRSPETLYICPAGATVSVGGSQDFKAFDTPAGATFNGCSTPLANGTTDVTSSANWSCGTCSIATVSNVGATKGTVTGTNAGSATITATYNAVAPATATVVVTPVSTCTNSCASASSQVIAATTCSNTTFQIDNGCGTSISCSGTQVCGDYNWKEVAP